MKILITGGTGFIGSNIITSLYEKNKIILIVRDKKNNNLFKKKNIKIINYKNYNELNNKLNKIKVDTVIHAATHYSKIHNFNDLTHFSNSNILFGILMELNLFTDSPLI